MCFLLLAPGLSSAKKAAPAVEASTGSGLPSYAPPTEAPTIELISARFAENDAKIKTLQASFRQFVRLEGSDAVQSVEGDISFKKPDFMRLTHRVPEPQTVVSDGTWLWVHRKGTNQVIQTRLDAWRKSERLASGLLDFGRSSALLTRYKTEITTVSAPGADGHRSFVLTLTPKAAPAEENFVLSLKADTRDYFPRETALRVGHASIRSLFEDVRLNPDISDDVFRFTPPADADLFKSPEPQK